MDNFYRYKAIVREVYDGDSCTVGIDLGFGIWMKGQKLRLTGIDTPELRGGERHLGLEVRDYMRNLVLGKEVILESAKDKSGKYGRWLATIWLDGININKKLLDEGMALPYDG